LRWTTNSKQAKSKSPRLGNKISDSENPLTEAVKMMFPERGSIMFLPHGTLFAQPLLADQIEEFGSL